MKFYHVEDWLQEIVSMKEIVCIEALPRVFEASVHTRTTGTQFLLCSRASQCTCSSKACEICQLELLEGVGTAVQSYLEMVVGLID